MSHIGTVILIVSSALMLNGCASKPKVVELSKQQVELNKKLLSTLEKYSEKAIEAKEMTLSHQSALLQLNSSPDDVYKMTKDRIRMVQGLDKQLSFRAYQDDIAKPLKLIADLTNYEIDFGNRPVNSTVWVSIPSAQRSAQDWIYDLHEQSKGRVNINIYPNLDALSSDGSVSIGDKKNGKIFVSFNSAK